MEQSGSREGHLMCVQSNCRMSFSTDSEVNFRMHYLVYHCSDMRLRCYSCNSVMETVDELIEHVNSQHPADWSPLFACASDGCSFGTNIMSKYKRHMMSKHKKVERILCPHCKSRFECLDMLYEHMSGKMMSYHRCPLCGVSSSLAVVIRNHIINEHPGSVGKGEMDVFMSCSRLGLQPLQDKKFLCSCDFQTTDLAQHLDHISRCIQHMKQLNPQMPIENLVCGELQTCPSCDYQCAFELLYAAHVELHSKPPADHSLYLYSCSSCPYVCNVRLQIIQHMAGHASRPALRLYRCSDCRFSSTDIQTTELHMEEIHPHLQSSCLCERVRLEFTCPACSTSPVQTEQLLVNHINSHHSNNTLAHYAWSNYGIKLMQSDIARSTSDSSSPSGEAGPSGEPHHCRHSRTSRRSSDAHCSQDTFDQASDISPQPQDRIISTGRLTRSRTRQVGNNPDKVPKHTSLL